MLAMDDLNHKGFTSGNPVETWPVKRVMTGIEQLAALHAGWKLGRVHG